MNAAYDEAYLRYRESYSSIFTEEHMETHRPELGECGKRDCAAVLLNGKYTLKSRRYTGMLQWNVHAVEHDLLNGDGTVLFRWKNLNDDGDFCRIIHHRDDNMYLIFREDLYGYSVFCMESGIVFRYLPDCAFPGRQEDFEETFIWIDVVYDRESDLLAVTGCYWACPFDILVLDFEAPMAGHRGLNGHDLADREYEIYDDIEFTAFQDGELILKGYNTRDGKEEFLRYKTEYIKELLRKSESEIREGDTR